MQRTLLTNSTSRIRLLATTTRPSCRVQPSKTSIRSFGKKVKRIEPAVLLDPHARAARLEDAGDAALKYKLDRNKYNKKYRARRALVKNIAEHKKKQKELLRNSSLVTKALNAPRRAAVKAMKEDWALGPLAPKRDIGELEGQLGTISLNQANLPEPTDAQVNQRWKMMGMNRFKEQDRVVVTQGRDRGKIGQIVLIDEVKMTCAIDGINRFAVRVPPFMRENDPRPTRVLRRDVPLHHIKLIYTLRQTDGSVKEVILDRMEFDNQEKIGNNIRYAPKDTKRYVPGTMNEIIDLSETKDEHDEDAEYGPDDTLSVSMDEETYVPSLLEMPMPMAAVQELAKARNKKTIKFSPVLEEKIRTKAVTHERKQMQLEDRMRTPLQELNVKLGSVQAVELAKRKKAFRSSVIVELGKAMAKNAELKKSARTGANTAKSLRRVTDSEVLMGGAEETYGEARV